MTQTENIIKSLSIIKNNKNKISWLDINDESEAKQIKDYQQQILIEEQKIENLSLNKHQRLIFDLIIEKTNYLASLKNDLYTDDGLPVSVYKNIENEIQSIIEDLIKIVEQ